MSIRSDRRKQLGAAASALLLAGIISGCGGAQAADSVADADAEAPVTYIEYLDPTFPADEITTVGSDVVVGSVSALREVTFSEEPLVVDGVARPEVIVGYKVADVVVEEVLRGEIEQGSTVSVLYDDLLAEGVEVAHGGPQVHPEPGERLVVAGEFADASTVAYTGLEGPVLVPFSTSALIEVESGTASRPGDESVSLEELRRRANESGG